MKTRTTPGPRSRGHKQDLVVVVDGTTLDGAAAVVVVVVALREDIKIRRYLPGLLLLLEGYKSFYFMVGGDFPAFFFFAKCRVTGSALEHILI